MLKFLKKRAADAGVPLELDVSPNLPMLRADERKMKQILLNLLSNALKFTPPGGKVTLAVSAHGRRGLGSCASSTPASASRPRTSPRRCRPSFRSTAR